MGYFRGVCMHAYCGVLCTDPEINSNNETANDEKDNSILYAIYRMYIIIYKRD